MITLKQVIHFPDTNSVEATWVDVIKPAQIIPAQIISASIDPLSGAEIPEQVIPEQHIPAVEQVVRCHSYADVQMDMFRADLGADAAQYVDLIAKVEAGIKPVVPAQVPAAAVVARYEALLDQHLDAVAQKYRYADRTRLALRAGYPNEDQPLAIAFGTWMDRDCNRPAKMLMLDVMAGKKPMPTEAEFIAGLPPFVPPAGF